MKHPLSSVLAFGIFFGISSLQAPVLASSTTTYPIHTYDNTTQLQNFALSSCINQAFDFKDPAVLADVQNAASAYVEFSRIDNPGDNYINLAKFVEKWLENASLNHTENPSRIAQCTKLYRSAELRELIDRYTVQFNAAAIAQLRDEALGKLCKTHPYQLPGCDNAVITFHCLRCHAPTFFERNRF